MLTRDSGSSRVATPHFGRRSSIACVSEAGRCWFSTHGASSGRGHGNRRRGRRATGAAGPRDLACAVANLERALPGLGCSCGVVALIERLARRRSRRSRRTVRLERLDLTWCACSTDFHSRSSSCRLWSCSPRRTGRALGRVRGRSQKRSSRSPDPAPLASADGRMDPRSARSRDPCVVRSDGWVRRSGRGGGHRSCRRW
jgi:hypothetical protein